MQRNKEKAYNLWELKVDLETGFFFFFFLTSFRNQLLKSLFSISEDSGPAMVHDFLIVNLAGQGPTQLWKWTLLTFFFAL